MNTATDQQTQAITWDHDRWRVRSTTGDACYFVRLDGPRPVCTCPDHRFRKRQCKHLQAVAALTTGKQS
jgi:uncharacterized Zn finger protein